MKLFRSALFGVTFLVVACTSTATDFVNKTQLLFGTPTASAVCPVGPCGITGFYLSIKQFYPNAVSPQADAQVQSLLTNMTMQGGLLDQLKNASAAADQAADLRGAVSVANQVLGIVASELGKISGVDPAITLGFQAAAFLIPIIAQTADQLVGQKATVGAAPRVFRNPDMTEERAKSVLRRAPIAK